MPETPKEKPLCEPVEPNKKQDSWEEDQEKRGYYYDDAYGYEVYRSEEDSDEPSNADHLDQEQEGAAISDDPEI